MPIRIYYRSLAPPNKTCSINMQSSDTVTMLLIELAAKGEAEDPDELRIQFSGKRLDEVDRSLSSYDIANESTVTVLKRLRGGAGSKRPRAAISMVEMKPMDSDLPGIKLLFGAVFNSVEWLGQLDQQQVTAYVNFLEKERNSERQKSGTIDFISEYVFIKAL